VIAVAEAIAYAHSRGVIHRDIKPANVLVCEFGETVVIDWGLARLVDDPAEAAGHPARTLDGLTLSGHVLGTPAYMPPEQAAGEPVDKRADVYALGALLYHVLAGKAPYSGMDSEDVLQRILDGPPAPLEGLDRGVPRPLAAIVDKAMARDTLRR